MSPIVGMGGGGVVARCIFACWGRSDDTDLVVFVGADQRRQCFLTLKGRWKSTANRNCGIIVGLFNGESVIIYTVFTVACHRHSDAGRKDGGFGGKWLWRTDN